MWCASQEFDIVKKTDVHVNYPCKVTPINGGGQGLFMAAWAPSFPIIFHTINLQTHGRAVR